MTIADKLLEIGLRCPCGRELQFVFNPVFALCRLSCPQCGGDIVDADRVSLLTKRLILTGGPVPGNVPPPDDSQCSGTSIIVLINDGLGYWEPKFNRWIHIPSNWPTNGPIDGWYFIARTESIIRPWLESEWREDAG